jgi:hypothetical protein
VKRIIALGLLLAGLSVAPAAALAHRAVVAPPSVLGVPTYGGPSVLGSQQGFVRPGSQPPRSQRFHGQAVVPAPHVQHVEPVWVHPQWAWNGWQWVWVPGYWAW